MSSHTAAGLPTAKAFLISSTRSPSFSYARARKTGDDTARGHFGGSDLAKRFIQSALPFFSLSSAKTAALNSVQVSQMLTEGAATIISTLRRDRRQNAHSVSGSVINAETNNRLSAAAAHADVSETVPRSQQMLAAMPRQPEAIHSLRRLDAEAWSRKNVGGFTAPSSHDWALIELRTG